SRIMQIFRGSGLMTGWFPDMKAGKACDSPLRGGGTGTFGVSVPTRQLFIDGHDRNGEFLGRAGCDAPAYGWMAFVVKREAIHVEDEELHGVSGSSSRRRRASSIAFRQAASSGSSRR